VADYFCLSRYPAGQTENLLCVLCLVSVFLEVVGVFDRNLVIRHGVVGSGSDIRLGITGRLEFAFGTIPEKPRFTDRFVEADSIVQTERISFTLPVERVSSLFHYRPGPFSKPGLR
jgi:hypothetical protein